MGWVWGSSSGYIRILSNAQGALSQYRPIFPSVRSINMTSLRTWMGTVSFFQAHKFIQLPVKLIFASYHWEATMLHIRQDVTRSMARPIFLRINSFLAENSIEQNSFYLYLKTNPAVPFLSSIRKSKKNSPSSQNSLSISKILPHLLFS